jgi:hypothetical protein
MRDAVYNKIIEMCENIIKTIGTSKSQEELSYTMIAALTGIIGICGGAKAAEKQDNSKIEKPTCEHKNMSKNKFFSLSYGHCMDCGEEALPWTD